MKKPEISRPTLGRIPLYLKYLRSLPPNTESISATAIAAGLGLGDVQVRKDLGILCGSGKPKTGYVRLELIESLESYLECKNGGAVIVGGGQLGKALLDYRGFETFGISVLAAFDKRTAKPNRRLRGSDIARRNASVVCENHELNLGVPFPPIAQETATCFMTADPRDVVLCAVSALQAGGRRYSI